MAERDTKAQTGLNPGRRNTMNDYSIPLSIAADLLEQSDGRALTSLSMAELARLRAALQRTLDAVDSRLAETEIDEILEILPGLAAQATRWND